MISTECTYGVIPINDQTKSHEKTLNDLGYLVEIDGNKLIVQAEFLPTGRQRIYDISTLKKAEEFFYLLTRGKRLVDFNTRLELPCGSKKYGRVLCHILREAEALVAALGYDPSALIAYPGEYKEGSKLGDSHGQNLGRNKETSSFEEKQNASRDCV